MSLSSQSCFALPPWVVMVLAFIALVGTGVNMYTICSNVPVSSGLLQQGGMLAC